MRLTLSIIFVLLPYLLPAQLRETFRASTLADFYEYRRPEFIAIHTDRASYGEGETIYYKLYLFNRPFSWRELSTVVYATLEDTAGHVILRQKLRAIQGRALGSIALPAALPHGRYTLKAFTLWMQKSSWPETARHQILIGKPWRNLPLQKPRRILQDSSMIVRENSPERLVVNVMLKEGGTASLHHENHILVEQTLESEQTSLVLENPPAGRVQATLSGPDGGIIKEHSIITHGRKPYLIKINSKKKEYETRERVNLEVQLTEANGNPLSANISVGVTVSRPGSPSLTDGTVAFSSILQPFAPHVRELLMYPPHPETLASIPFSLSTPDSDRERRTTVGEIQLDTLGSPGSELGQRVREAYGTPVQAVKVTAYHLPFDDEYLLVDYPTLATVGEFLREVIPYIRVIKRRGHNEVRIVNAEQKGKVFRYAKNPLILIDGKMYEDITKVLNINLNGLERLNVTWRTSTINFSTLGSLAGNGIISLYTKKGWGSVLPKEEEVSSVDIFSTFSTPVMPDFSGVPSWNERYPDMRDLVYWNPDISFSGKTRFSFHTTDEKGDYTVSITGITASGLLIEDTFLIKVIDEPH